MVGVIARKCCTKSKLQHLGKNNWLKVHQLPCIKLHQIKTEGQLTCVSWFISCVQTYP